MKGDNIAERLLDFAAQSLLIVGEMDEGTARAKHVSRQLTRAATAGGANYEEARSAESRADFAHKALIAAKEMSESVYWLRLVERTRLSQSDRLPATIREGSELVAILEASARTARGRTQSE